MKLKMLAWTAVAALAAVGIILLFAFNPYLLKLIKCGIPKPTNYSCSNYAIIKPSNPIPIPVNSVRYNKFSLSKPQIDTLNKYNTYAFLIVQDNKLIFEKYFRGCNEQTKFNSFSIAKSIISLLTGIALEYKFIDSLDQNVSDFLPQFKGTHLTIRHLLSMSSGIKWNENFVNPFSDIVKAYYSNDIKQFLTNIRFEHEPGQLWKYQCINSVILGQIIEKASGLSLAKFTQKYLWQQINATSEAFWWQDQNHIIKAFCCFFATARDYAKIAITVLQGGKYFHNYVVTPQYISQMFTPNLHLKNKYGDTINYFGLHAWLTYYKGLRINYFRGMYGQYIILIPQKNAAIIHLGFKQVPPSRKHLPQDFKDYLAIGLDILNQSNYSAM